MQATSSGGGRKSPLRARRRRVRILFALVGVLAIVSTAYGISWISYLPRFSLLSVTVAGTENVSPRIVKAYIETRLFDSLYPFLSRQNIFLYPRAELEKQVTEYFPRIRTVEITREALLAKSVVVTVEEREARGRWCTGSGECYLLDESGFIFAPEATSSPSTVQYTFTGTLLSAGSPARAPRAGGPVGQTFLPEHFLGVFTLLQELARAGFTPRGALVENLPAQAGEQDFSIPLAKGYILRVSFGSELEKIVRNLELVLSSDALRGRENELEYIDLRFGNRVYYKFREQ